MSDHAEEVEVGEVEEQEAAIAWLDGRQEVR